MLKGRGLIIGGACLFIGGGEYLFLDHLITETDWRNKSNCSLLERHIADYERIGEEFVEDSAPYTYYCDKAERCQEELKIQRDWMTNSGMIKKYLTSPPPIDYIYIDYGKRFD